MPPSPPSGVLKRTEQSAIWDKGPRGWASRPELTPSSSGASKPLLCIRSAVLLPGGSQGFPSVLPTIEIPHSRRAKILREALEESVLTEWFAAMGWRLGVETIPRWEEAGYTSPSFAGFALSHTDTHENPWPLPLHAYCGVTSGPASRSDTDGLALALDLLIDMPFPAEEVTSEDEEPDDEGSPETLILPGPSASPWPTPELKSLSALVQMMTSSAISATRTSASRLLKQNATSGDLGVWLASTVPFGDILDLDQFPAVLGSGPGPSEVSVFARLPLEPSEKFDADPQPDSLRGLAVHLIDQLLQQEHRREYAETLHALRGPANRN